MFQKYEGWVEANDREVPVEYETAGQRVTSLLSGWVEDCEEENDCRRRHTLNLGRDRSEVENLSVYVY